MQYHLYNEDCITGCKKHLKDNSVDLIITDPPYGIKGDTLHKHYHRNEDHVVKGYVEIPSEQYSTFSKQWIKQAERILKPGGSIYIVSGYTNLYHILSALHSTSLEEVNHIIWKYNFGVYTKNKFISSHYHILYWVKPGGKPTFNTYATYGAQEKDTSNGSLNYQDREDVWIINRDYKPGKQKNKNELPVALLQKMIQYSSKEGDLICDLFLGGFSTATVALGMKRNIIGFEISKNIFDHGMRKIQSITPGFLLPQLRQPTTAPPSHQGAPWSEEELACLYQRYHDLYDELGSKAQTIYQLCEEFGRGRFAIMNALDRPTKK